MTRPKPIDIAEQRRTVEPFRNLRLHAAHAEALDDLQATRFERDMLIEKLRWTIERLEIPSTAHDGARPGEAEALELRLWLAERGL